MFSTATMLVALALGAPGPGKVKDKDVWVGVTVYPRANDVESFTFKDGQFESFDINLFFYEYLVVEEKNEFVRVVQDGHDRWLKKEAVVRVHDGIKFFNEQLEHNPNDIWLRGARTSVLMRSGDLKGALKDVNVLVKDDPRVKEWLTLRANIYIQLKDYQRAVDDCTHAIKELDDADFYSYHMRALAYMPLKKYQEALGDLDTAIERNASFYWSHAHKAIALASIPEAKSRDGRKALECAQEAKRLAKNEDGIICDAFACAYAELGQFERAIEYMKKAIDDAVYMKDSEKEARKKLALFRDHKPFRNE